MALLNKVRYMAEDLWGTPDDGNRYEILNGQLIMTPPPITEHQGASGTLHGYIWPHVHRHRLGKVFSAPVGVTLDDDNGLQPDLVYVSSERSHIISRRGIEGAPDLVVEILSPSTRRYDRGAKLRRYAAAGVPHYWIVDPRTRALEVYVLSGDSYELTGMHGPGSVFRPTLFPGLEIPIDDLWA